MNITYEELRYLLGCGDTFRLLADHHDLQATMAHAADFPECVTTHDARKAELLAESVRLDSVTVDGIVDPRPAVGTVQLLHAFRTHLDTPAGAKYREGQHFHPRDVNAAQATIWEIAQVIDTPHGFRYLGRAPGFGTLMVWEKDVVVTDLPVSRFGKHREVKQ